MPAALHFANLAPSAKKTTLLSVLPGDHKFGKQETMQSYIESGQDKSTWAYPFSLVIIKDAEPSEMEYLLDEIQVDGEWVRKYSFSEPPKSSPAWNALRYTGQIEITKAEFKVFEVMNG